MRNPQHSPRTTMTTHTHSAQKLKIAKRHNGAEMCMAIAAFGGGAGMPETPALREVDL